jgi:hypothetical protein
MFFCHGDSLSSRGSDFQRNPATGKTPASGPPCQTL